MLVWGNMLMDIFFISIFQLNVASLNHGKSRNSKHSHAKNARGETDFKYNSDDIILNQRFSDRKKDKFEHHRNKHHYKNKKFNANWEDDDVILDSFNRKKASARDKIYNSNHFKRHRHRGHHYDTHGNMKSADDTILGTNFNMDTFFDDLQQGDQDYQQIYV